MRGFYYRKKLPFPCCFESTRIESKLSIKESLMSEQNIYMTAKEQEYVAQAIREIPYWATPLLCIALVAGAVVLKYDMLLLGGMKALIFTCIASLFVLGGLYIFYRYQSDARDEEKLVTEGIVKETDRYMSRKKSFGKMKKEEYDITLSDGKMVFLKPLFLRQRPQSDSDRFYAAVKGIKAGDHVKVHGTKRTSHVFRIENISQGTSMDLTSVV